jgi:hypothetical protein
VSGLDLGWLEGSSMHMIYSNSYILSTYYLCLKTNGQFCCYYCLDPHSVNYFLLVISHLYMLVSPHTINQWIQKYNNRNMYQLWQTFVAIYVAVIVDSLDQMC